LKQFDQGIQKRLLGWKNLEIGSWSDKQGSRKADGGILQKS
jgi:hypothetical protein